MRLQLVFACLIVLICRLLKKSSHGTRLSFSFPSYEQLFSVLVLRFPNVQNGSLFVKNLPKQKSDLSCSLNSTELPHPISLVLLLPNNLIISSLFLDFFSFKRIQAQKAHTHREKLVSGAREAALLTKEERVQCALTTQGPRPCALRKMVLI